VLAVVVWAIPLIEPGSLFWDDWVLLLGDPVADYRTSGVPWVGYFTAGLMALGPWAFKAVALVSIVVTGLMAYAIGGARLGARPIERWLLAAFVIVAPLNVAQSSVGVLTNYSASLAIFALAWWLLVATPATRPGPVRAVLATLLFFVSFTTASLLPFLAVPAMHFLSLYLDPSRGVLRGLGSLLARYWYLPVAPILFWVLHERVFPASGVYADYNSLSIPTDPASPLAAGIALAGATIVVGVALTALRHRIPTRVPALALGVLALAHAAFLAWTRGSWQPSAVVTVGVVGLAGVALIGLGLTRRRGAAAPAAWLRTPEGFAALGLGLMALGSLPYLLARKLASFQDWETRHQLLLPFGLALLVVAGLRVLERIRPGRLSLAVGCGAGIAMAAAAAFGPISLLADWHKQEGVIAALEATPGAARASTVIVQDETTGWNYGGRVYRFYEWSALLHAAYGGPARLAVPDYPGAMSAAEVVAIAVQDPPRYGVAGWTDGGPVETVRITQTGGYRWWDLLLGRAEFRVDVVAG